MTPNKVTILRVADNLPRTWQLPRTPFERSRSHGRRYACLFVEASLDVFAFAIQKG